MKRETTRRAVLGAAVGAGVAGGFLSPASSFLDRFAPLSGSVWGSAHTSRQDSVESPYGPAQLRHDDAGVAHVSADDEAALYYAVGYAQGADRLFQMDAQRRLFRGELSAIVGETTLDSDRFHRKMAFREAAEATVEHLRGSPVENPLVAYRDGVNAAIQQEPLPLECRLLEYEPDPWTLVDSMLVEKIISWQLTGSFRTLRRALVRDRFDEELAAQLYPRRFDHDVPIIQERHGQNGGTTSDRDRPTPPGTSDDSGRSGDPVGPELLDWLGQFEPAPGLGSNSWVIGTEHAAGDAPLLGNDPHLGLQAPPTWYEMQIDGPDHRARGVTFPGVPFVVIGENDAGAWGFTNAGADVIDFYRYERDGETYRYGDEQRSFDVRTEEIEVDGGSNETVEVRTSVHGPVIEEAEQEVGVAWTGHAATETTIALYELTHSTGVEEVIDAIERFETPTQNFVYASRDGETLYQMTGRIPVRRTDGEPVSGDQVFDGSAREGEWAGFEPFGRSSWDGFVPVSENPRVRNPGYLSTANQQIIPDDQLEYYLAASYGAPYRGERIDDRLSDRIESGEPVDTELLQDLGRDTFDGRAAALVDPLVEAARAGDDDLEDAADRLADWDFRMDADSRAALLFDRWMDHYREEIFEEPLEERGLDDDYYPSDGAIEALPADSGWFGPGGRAAAMRRALRAAIDEVDDEGHEVYGDISHTGRIGHLLGLDFLAYPSHERGGSAATVWNFDPAGPWGGSWEMLVDLDGELFGLLPGGNSGRYFSEHYDDQIQRWASGEYRQLSRTIQGDLSTEFVGGDE